MSSAAIATPPFKVPPFKALAAALRKTTEHLARELAQPSASPPDWSDLDWAIARAAAALQGISTLLANRLPWGGPPGWQSFLAEQREQAMLRDARIGELLRQIDAATRRAQIPCVALKGAALRALDLYRPGERPMGDVDLLIRPGDATAIAAALREIGYVEIYATRRHVVYAPPHGTMPKGYGEHVESPLKIEAHTRVSELLPVRAVDITARVYPAQPQPGLNAYPSAVALLLHLLLHAAGNMRAHALRQIQLHDIAHVAGRFQDADWRALLAARRAAERPWWAFPPLALAARYYPRFIPPEILRELRGCCSLPLRLAIDRQALTDVSWSNLRIHAFPGIEWSRSPLDALRFIVSRALPGRMALAELQTALDAQPQLKQVRWYGARHGERIARWLFSRPPRVQTITTVRAVLGDCGR